MAKYPKRIPVEPYRGSNPRLKQKWMQSIETARQIEDYINKEMENSEEDVRILNYGSIAVGLGIGEETVRDLLYPIDCGYNGITVHKK